MKSFIKIIAIIFFALSLPVMAQEEFSDITIDKTSDYAAFLDVYSVKEHQPDENIYSDIIPHHKLFFGQVSVYEDKTSYRNIDSASDIGVKISGGRGFLNYSAGVYNINQAGGWASINLFDAIPEAGKLQLGSGVFTNTLATEAETNRQNSYNIFTDYKFKRYSTRAEFIRQDYTFYDDMYYDSWHFTNKYQLSSNLSLKAAVKEYEQTKSIVNDFGVEYSLGNIKLELDTSIIKYKENTFQDSQRFEFTTRYSF